ncbi:sulfate/molybdate ABC transporter ATP-binding protein [Cyanobium sp. Morenito 9A2]|uniref:sulfate/molybdate ABC transporter ATP-binding protein n=1 Tax=Cyanobium sp. Morenito 9A2 TaxID=2823718 RepID=UPI0020CC0604|nr:TOBE-like domain-containing protein [Cyanobium sp. Morenito 9A2]MCP9848520.1 TOBE-like domain-containing protein [Cyanobium sp. Morenito 9A2]
MGIRVSHVTKAFGGLTAVDDLSLDVGTGSLVALLGPSGCGKSTLLRIIAGLDAPDAGRVWINGEEATARSVQERNVGFVFQHFALFKHRSVRENIAFGLELRRWSKDKIRWRVEELLNLVQLQGYGNRYPSQLSGGQRQRVSLARALAVKPKLMLLDEPFSALDAKVRKELRVWLRTLQEETKVTTMFVTHDQEEAFEVADKIVVINRGHIEQIGTAAEIYDHPATPFVLNFVGQVNRLPDPSSQGAKADIFVRPHDLMLLEGPEIGSLPAQLNRVTHLGRDLFAELQLDNGEKIVAQLSRDSVDHNRLQPGDRLHVRPKQGRRF